jgi:thymidylate synthase
VTNYRNAGDAFVGELASIVAGGSDVSVRGSATRELLGRTVEIDKPLERCITLPGRNNSISAAIAETLWVLAGRDDIDYLLPYIPRAREFSDDGVRWRGAYGPRLRDWHGIDQIGETRELLIGDSASRRAVMELFDPGLDFIQSRDIPCNNWLHFLIRDGRLDLHVAIRSNDVWWGFSGINTFEWSVLHEAMAYWLSVEVGVQRYFISSLHLYERHFDSAQRVLAESDVREYPSDSVSPWSTAWPDLEQTLAQWFELEKRIREGQVSDGELRDLPDPLLADFLRVLRATWAQRHQDAQPRVDELLQEVVADDLRGAAADEILRLRRHPVSGPVPS